MSAHVAFVLNDAPFFLSHRRVLGETLINRGFKVSLVAPSHAEAETVVRGLGMGFQAWNVTRRGVNPLREAWTIASLTKIYRQIRPDLVHHVTQKPVLYGSVASRLAGVPHVVNAVSGLGYAFTEGSGGGGLLGRVMLAMHRLCHGSSGTRTIFQNPNDLSTFVAQKVVPAGQARLIRGSGVDTAVYHPAPSLPNAPIVVLPARMLKDKGVNEAIEAVRLLRLDGVAIELLLAGGIDAGNPSTISSSQLLGWQDKGECTWLDHVADMPACFRQARICCLPSYREGLPKSLIEAASCGLPIVTCDVPGCREIVRHEMNGLLVPPRDPRALASALLRLIKDQALCFRLGQCGRSMVLAEFTIDHIVNQHIEIYKELLGNKWEEC